MAELNELQSELKALVERGLSFGDVLTVFSQEEEPDLDADAMVDRARQEFGSERIDIESAGIFSPGDDGCWVLAWVLVQDDEDEDRLVPS